ncbi:unnamed protein product [Pleuronectes platessa]|uniref:Uncharacterized protein n=1 Tax=Pleuronectes platessa TaxID=8262 RepID=A0A9N7UTY1_PLEPL|nr:unnamed protein product [Pleuronectes platessa]
MEGREGGREGGREEGGRKRREERRHGRTNAHLARLEQSIPPSVLPTINHLSVPIRILPHSSSPYLTSSRLVVIPLYPSMPPSIMPGADHRRFLPHDQSLLSSIHPRLVGFKRSFDKHYHTLWQHCLALILSSVRSPLRTLWLRDPLADDTSSMPQTGVVMVRRGGSARSRGQKIVAFCSLDAAVLKSYTACLFSAVGPAWAGEDKLEPRDGSCPEIGGKVDVDAHREWVYGLVEEQRRSPRQAEPMTVATTA